MTPHRITDTERAALARVPPSALFALAAPTKRIPRSLFAQPQVLILTLQRLALARMKAGEFCLLTTGVQP